MRRLAEAVALLAGLASVAGEGPQIAGVEADEADEADSPPQIAAVEAGTNTSGGKRITCVVIDPLSGATEPVVDLDPTLGWTFSSAAVADRSGRFYLTSLAESHGSSSVYRIDVTRKRVVARARGKHDRL